MATLSGLFMGTSAPLVKNATEDVSLQNLVAETPMLPLKKGKLAKAGGGKAELYRLQRQQKAEAKAAAGKRQQKTVLLTKEADDQHDYMANLDISILSKYTRMQA